ncbi:MAG TPA: hypothetical protein PLS49_01615, partial [Candidatus Woesebacteria bacterium]|nr:hypothetical protein [Candidatus Woesebacteria bacterium]
MHISEITQNSHEQLARTYTPEIQIFETSEEADTFAAERLIQQIQMKPDSVLTLPTGTTPIGMYNQIVDVYNQGIVDFSAATIFNLDEYYPIDKNALQSYHRFMRVNLFDHIDIDQANCHIP